MVEAAVSFLGLSLFFLTESRRWQQGSSSPSATLLTILDLRPPWFPPPPLAPLWLVQHLFDVIGGHDQFPMVEGGGGLRNLIAGAPRQLLHSFTPTLNAWIEQRPDSTGSCLHPILLRLPSTCHINVLPAQSRHPESSVSWRHCPWFVFKSPISRRPLNYSPISRLTTAQRLADNKVVNWSFVLQQFLFFAYRFLPMFVLRRSNLSSDVTTS